MLTSLPGPPRATRNRARQSLGRWGPPVHGLNAHSERKKRLQKQLATRPGQPVHEDDDARGPRCRTTSFRVVSGSSSNSHLLLGCSCQRLAWRWPWKRSVSMAAVRIALPLWLIGPGLQDRAACRPQRPRSPCSPQRAMPGEVRRLHRGGRCLAPGPSRSPARGRVRPASARRPVAARPGVAERAEVVGDVQSGRLGYSRPLGSESGLTRLRPAPAVDRGRPDLGIGFTYCSPGSACWDSNQHQRSTPST